MKVLDVGLKEKELSHFYESLSAERKSTLNKVLFSIHEKIAEKQNVFGIKSSKIIAIQQKIVVSEGVGSLARSLFSIQK